MVSLGSAACLLTVAIAGQDVAPEKRLEFLLGNWESKEVTTSGTQEIEFTLKGTNRWTLGGTTLQIDETFKIQDRDFANHILIRWIPAAKHYKMWWFTKSGPEPLVFKGTFVSENNLVFEPFDEKDARQLKIIYDILGPGHYKARLEMKDGDKWVVRTRAEYKRTSL